ncbi:gliding motility-associated peptidyl-prolyl isomerase GldI [uncultured Kriegella sp.]|mgnify:CR=1 FL=1|uniref:gliding motility-associated peptidyl-prolyl isomerase GldI n=1 Tax=uncultured Kriegella sp. TaxID=1798910 RepID=UPI0030DBF1E6
MDLRRCCYLLCLIMGLSSCEGPQPRRPVKVKTGSFFKASTDRSKKLLAQEEATIQEIIAKDTTHTYQHSSYGSWYYYDQNNKSDDYTPQPDDLVTLTYNIVTFDNDTLYSNEDIGVIKYKVDKQELFQGLRNSVKLLKENETATFLFPSSLAYGYHGDNNKIGVSVPIKATISLLKIEKSNEQIQN